jgi:hypothetical protein
MWKGHSGVGYGLGPQQLGFEVKRLLLHRNDRREDCEFETWF